MSSFWTPENWTFHGILQFDKMRNSVSWVSWVTVKIP